MIQLNRLLFASLLLSALSLTHAVADPPDGPSGDDLFNMHNRESTPVQRPKTSPRSPGKDTKGTPDSSLPTSRPNTAEITKLPVPSLSAQAASAKLINELYNADLTNASSVEQKISLQHKMLQAARDEHADMVGKYVLFGRARDYALTREALVDAFDAIDEMAKQYQVDNQEMKATSVAIATKSAHSDSDRSLFASQALVLAKGEVLSGNFDLAKQLTDLATVAALSRPQSWYHADL